MVPLPTYTGVLLLLSPSHTFTGKLVIPLTFEQGIALALHLTLPVQSPAGYANLFICLDFIAFSLLNGITSQA